MSVARKLLQVGVRKQVISKKWDGRNNERGKESENEKYKSGKGGRRDNPFDKTRKEGKKTGEIGESGMTTAEKFQGSAGTFLAKWTTTEDREGTCKL